ncbi:MAG TPA: helix-turn-helix transcriptional regulator [Dehalococcoidia bacterium]|nr:helix-turn-helix transcriptional regulator [Dehalococcoidia bacterium]
MKRRGRPPHPDVLTPRQWQVLALIRDGLTDREIALRLGISLDGVKFHVSEILGKLGVTSRNEAARWHQQRTAAPTACLAGRRRLGPKLSAPARTKLAPPRRGEGPGVRFPARRPRPTCRRRARPVAC